MNRLRKWLLVLVPVALLGWGIYAFIFNWIVPKSATLTMPRKWKRIPFRQPAETAHGYFGTPARTVGNMEEWTGGITDRRYYLRIYYGSDSTVIAYSVYYSYKSRLVSKDYLMDSISLR